jgi:hypothetical protein
MRCSEKASGGKWGGKNIAMLSADISMLSADIARRRMPNTIPKRCPGLSWTTKR